MSGHSSSGVQGQGDVILRTTPTFVQSVNDAEQLLAYAARTGRFPREAGEMASGKTFKSWVIEAILNARLAVENEKVPKDVATEFWASFADLSRITAPVTGASLRASEKSPIRTLKGFVLLLSLLLIFSSTFLFMNNSTSTEVADLVAKQNVSALKLWSDMQFFRSLEASPEQESGGADGPAATQRGTTLTPNRAYAAMGKVTLDELFAEIVEFNRNSSWLLQTVSRLNFWFNPVFVRIDPREVVFDKSNYESIDSILVSPNIKTRKEILDEGVRQIVIYQYVRNYATAVRNTNSIMYGGISTYFLPALYALLGAALYGFRLYSRLVRNKTYLPSSADSARYFIALIAGIVIGLFSSLIPTALALPPLVISFLVGYAVEAFFSRLDSTVAKFKAEVQKLPSQDQEQAQPIAPAPVLRKDLAL